ncbi:MAG: aspartate kinase [Clostridia bacterium]|nr:aspartate kinase [Clostridia bacterium]
MGIVVQKYGGSSVANSDRLRHVAHRIINYYKMGHQVVAVVSARGDTTDELIALAQEVASDPPPREMDMLLATGEQVSIALLAMTIHSMGYPAISLTGAQVGIRTDDMHTKAKILEVACSRLLEELKQNKIVIVAGFQGVTDENEITTLGRGGSDATAVAIAAALKADVCEIYTDVEGVFTADPRLVPSARKLNKVSYDEMLELASLGAVVLQPRSVELAKLHQVRLCVRSSFNDNTGTWIEENPDMERDNVVTGIAQDMNIAELAIFDVPDRPGIAYKLFSALANAGINVDMIIQSTMRDDYNDISFTICKDDLKQALKVLEVVTKELGASGFTYDDQVAKVSIVGAGMITNPGVAAKMFEALAEKNINIQMISTSEIKVSCVVKLQDAELAVQALHEKFGLAG